MAQPKFILLSRSIGVTLPDRSTFKSVHAPVALKPVVHRPLVVSDVVNAVAHKLLPSADQSRVAIPAQPGNEMRRSWASSKENSLITG